MKDGTRRGRADGGKRRQERESKSASEPEAKPSVRDVRSERPPRARSAAQERAVDGRGGRTDAGYLIRTHLEIPDRRCREGGQEMLVGPANDGVSRGRLKANQTAGRAQADRSAGQWEEAGGDRCGPAARRKPEAHWAQDSRKDPVAPSCTTCCTPIERHKERMGEKAHQQASGGSEGPPRGKERRKSLRKGR